MRKEAVISSMLSVVIPCFNEQEALPQTHLRLLAVLEGISECDFELIYVDDGSDDGTLELLRDFQGKDSRVRVLALSRNFGQPAASTAGLAEAAGDAVVIMDADLQDPPEVILDMLARWRGGADVAYGVRSARQGETRFKRISSTAFHRLFNLVSDISIPLETGEFRLMDRKVVDAFLAMPERCRGLRGMLSWAGFRQEPVHFQRPPRSDGATKYNLSKMLRTALDSLLPFSIAPLRLATWLGLLSVGLAMIGIFFALIQRIVADVWISGATALFVALLFLGGLQMVLIGVLGEYLARIYREVQQRPLYLVKERLGFEFEDQARRSSPATQS